MGQNNDPTEHGDLQGQQGAAKGKPRSAYMTSPDREGINPFRGGDAARPHRPASKTGEDAQNDIPLPAEKD